MLLLILNLILFSLKFLAIQDLFEDMKIKAMSSFLKCHLFELSVVSMAYMCVWVMTSVVKTFLI